MENKYNHLGLLIEKEGGIFVFIIILGLKSRIRSLFLDNEYGPHYLKNTSQLIRIIITCNMMKVKLTPFITRVQITSWRPVNTIFLRILRIKIKTLFMDCSLIRTEKGQEQDKGQPLIIDMEKYS